MKNLRFFHYLLLAFFVFNGCKKDISNKDCLKLKNAIQANNIVDTKNIITQIINTLTAKSHTEQNLARLVSAISGECNITAEIICFACIQTLPEQSEIRITVNLQGTQSSKTIDISSTPDNIMMFVNMHD